MQSNIELKARCADLSHARQVFENIGAVDSGLLLQTDTYFAVASGRLKLRQIEPDKAELIHYHRPDRPDIRQSQYTVIPIEPLQIQPLLNTLSTALGVRVRVVKQRQLLMWQQVRIHLDTVENLGTFIEFEGLTDQINTQRLAAERVAQLRTTLGIVDRDLISQSYSDLMLARV